MYKIQRVAVVAACCNPELQQLQQLRTNTKMVLTFVAIESTLNLSDFHCNKCNNGLWRKVEAKKTEINKVFFIA